MRSNAASFLSTSTIIYLILNLNHTVQAQEKLRSPVSSLGKDKNNDKDKDKSCKPILHYDDVCTKFCSDYFMACTDPNFFDGGVDGCLKKCAEFPRTDGHIDPSNVAGDKFECRRFHLNLAMNDTGTGNIRFHCLHATEEGAGVCVDTKVNGVTPYRALSKGTCNMKQIGYCTLFASNTVANCTNPGINDDTIPKVLQMLPSGVEILFLKKNSLLTTLSDGVFENLKSPSSLKALYLDNCNISSATKDSFRSLSNLKVLSLSRNRLASIPSDLLVNTPKLRQFDLIGGDVKLKSLPAVLFRNTPKMEQILLYAHELSSFPVGFFQGLSKLKTMSFIDNKFTTSGIPDDTFKDLVSLKEFHLFLNEISEVKSAWFGSWAKKIVSVVLWKNQIESVSKETFSSLESLEYLFLHDNPIDFISDDALDNHDELKQVTLGKIAA